MAWFFRALQRPDGTWACRHGLQEYDVHPELTTAIEHVTALARDHRPAEVVVHWLDGTVQRLGLV